jgi:hypothetical protein
VKDLIILGMSKAFIKKVLFRMYIRKNFLLDKAIVKVVNIKKLVSKNYLCVLGSVREKNLCVLKIIKYRVTCENNCVS